MRNQMDTSALCRPVVYITVRQPTVRTQIRELLEHQGWTVIEEPTGAHLIAEIADLIEGQPWRVPAMIVVDKIAPGCAGTTIATGLRELGVAIPVVLVEDPAAALIEAQRVGAAALQEYAGRYVSGSSPGRPDKIRSAG
jgi:FixJ family two-component response regulator